MSIQKFVDINDRNNYFFDSFINILLHLLFCDFKIIILIVINYCNSKFPFQAKIFKLFKRKT